MEALDSKKKTIRNENEKKKIKARISRIIGQLNGVSKMVDEDRYCDDLLIQLSAINSAVKGIANHIIEMHLHNCVVREINNGNTDIITEVVNLFKRFQ